MNPEKEPIERRIKQWLEKQGYPLEMTVANAFQKAKFTASVADFFKDFGTHEAREIDVTALRWSDLDQPAILQVCYRIECKQTRENPWIVFFSQAQPDVRFLPLNLICSKVYRSFLWDRYMQKDFREQLLAAPIFKIMPLCYGVRQAFGTGTDAAYSAVMSATKASVAQALNMDSLFDGRLSEKEKPACCVVFPVVVLDGRLFISYVGTQGELSVKELPSAVLHWGRSNPVNASPFVHIVTRPHLEEFIKSADEAANILIAATQNQMDYLVEIARGAYRPPVQLW